MEENGCPRCRELSDRVQNHLRRLSELLHAEQDAVANKAENLWKALDQELEREFGAKERSMGVLAEHTASHGGESPEF